jgi:hypothetical protein
MEKLVITYQHPLSALPYSYKKPDIPFSFFRPKKRREMINSQKQLIEKKLKIELDKWCNAVTELNNENENFFYNSVVPSIELINKYILELSEKIIFLETQPQMNSSIYKWKISLFNDIYDKLKNTSPSFEAPPITHSHVIERIKEVNYLDCIHLYKLDPEKYHLNVTDKLPETKDKIAKAAGWIRMLDDKGVISHLRKLPEFKSQDTSLASFLKVNFNSEFSIEAIRTILRRID